MSATPFDSTIYRDLFGDEEIGKLFTDTAEIRAMLIVEGALAKSQGELNIIPQTAAKAIHRASLEVQIDPASLTKATGQNGVPVPALVAQFRSEMNAPDHAQFVHWGATSQDIVDTALALRLRQALSILEDRLSRLASKLGGLAADHADVPMLARTWGQAAVPTSFGAVVADWGAPLLGYRSDLARIRSNIERVSLSGAAGTSAALPDPNKTREAIADALGLGGTENTSHSVRSAQMALAGWLSGICGSLGKFGDDLVFLAATGIHEISITGGGSSSTMPQKSNPVGPSALVALSHHTVGLNATIQSALVHGHQRDGRAWFAEWLALPQLIAAAGRSLLTAQAIADGLHPNIDQMYKNIEATGETVFAEALTFELAKSMARPEAQAQVKELVARASAEGRRLSDVACEARADLDRTSLFSSSHQLGQAPTKARAFAAAANPSHP